MSAMVVIDTHASEGYGHYLNDRATNGWPGHRRNEAWKLPSLSHHLKQNKQAIFL